MKEKPLTRRDFIKFSGLSTALAAASTLKLSDLAAASAFNPLPISTPILVVLTLYGGNDGLNTIVPVNDPIYQSLRPGLALNQSGCLPLSGDLFLNGSMPGFKYLWDQKKLAIINGVGYPNPDRSHFSSMAIWQTASPNNSESTGWIGRWLDSQKHDPMRVVSIGSTPSPLIAGEKEVGSVLPLNGFHVPNGKFGSDLKLLSNENLNSNSFISRGSQSIGDLFALNSDVAQTLKNPAPDVDPTVQALTQAGASFGSDASLSQQFDVVAKLIDIGVPTRVWSLSMGGFDTHADEISSQNGLLGILSSSVTRFFGQIQKISRANDVVIMVYSEFGRRVAANASEGTDHGTAGPMFVIGNKVKGGFYGQQPSLTDLNQGDLWSHVDFRDVYGGILQDVLKTPVDRVIPNWNTTLSVF
jgi:uncharacterized protein (DUF1501 family)